MENELKHQIWMRLTEFGNMAVLHLPSWPLVCSATEVKSHCALSPALSLSARLQCAGLLRCLRYRN